MSDSFSVLGLIPARGGSKSIPYKNLAPLAGRPLLAYVARAAHHAAGVTRLLCSTEDARIADACRQLGVAVDRRPPHLAEDDTPIVQVLEELLGRLQAQGELPDAVALLQPTSPFLLPDHIDGLVRLLRENPAAGSAQTIAPMPHNHHAYNQRRVNEKGEIVFAFPEERARCYNKQTKPVFHAFGNLILTRSHRLLAGEGVFAQPSLALSIPRDYAFDLDGPEDLAMAEWLLASQRVRLPHWP